MQISSIFCMVLVCNLSIYPCLASLIKGVGKRCPECLNTKPRKQRLIDMGNTLVSLETFETMKCHEFPGRNNCDGNLTAEGYHCLKCGTLGWIPRTVCPFHNRIPPPLIFSPQKPGEKGSTSNA
ncbi:hypothetical protein PGT21_024182 [Puccinia graminis f. sp. tritici]|uniref:Uncharacterized protein n=1 Tax=Puccinia graminis f. sp. tritici TaxID=56615 RepID=A0A5B0PJ15_PUCGR|nr:hypothetical protein PGT21_024182 [Puccinia graminis f. sp. tritici]KAA1123484.1 hypothetical protein PGTUg99_019599 [Puccinia graminis f. sp. tritici]